MRASMTGSKHTGFSLVELMVGMVLGIMLIVGAVAIYLASQRSYVEVEQVAALSENARFAQKMVDDSLRHAGFFGEASATMVELDPDLTDVVGDCKDLAAAHNLDQFIFAAATDDDDVKDCIEDAYVPESDFVNDVLVIKHVVPRPYTDCERIPDVPCAGDGEISFPDELSDDKTWVMTNNVSGLMFDGNDTPPDISAGGAMPNSSAWEYQYEVFYIRQADKDTPPQLSRRVLVWNGAAMELQTEDLVEGVENLRLMFGFDDNGDGEVDRYTNADGVTDWAQVDSVEVYMLVRSATTDPQYTDDKTYQVGDEAVTPKDAEEDDPDAPHYRRLLVFTSVSVRNLQLIIRGEA